MGDTLDLVTKAAAGVGEIKSLVTPIFDTFIKWKNLKSSTDSLVRIFYLEVCKNIELLEVVNFDHVESIEYTDANLQFILAHFDMTIMAMIFLDDEKDRWLYSLLKKKGKIERSDEEDDLKKTGRFFYENILQAVSFVYVKVDILQKLATLKENNDLLRHVNVKTRLKNVRSRLIMIKKVLEEMEPIKPIVREIKENR